MALILKECLDLYQSTFPQNWVKEYIDVDETKLFEGVSKITDFNKQAFILLSKSAISGEYLLNHYKTVLRSFLSKVTVETGTTHIEGLYAQVNIDLKETLTTYLNFIISVEDKIINHEEEVFLKAYKNNKNKISSEYAIDFIGFVLALSNIDHFFVATQENRQTLIFLHKGLEDKIKVENEDLKTIYGALLDKCNFLLKKIFYDTDLKRRYYIDEESYDVDVISQNHILLKDLSAKYDFLYNKKDTRIDFNRNIWDYQKNCINKSSKASELVLLMKHYKKDNVSEQQASNLLQSFNDLYSKIYNQKVKSDFNLLALNTIKNYLYNSRFAIRLLSDNYGVERLRCDVQELENIQIETHIHNYFPFYCALKFLGEKISKELVEEKNNVDYIENEIEYYKTLLDKFQGALNWCSRNRYYPFQLLLNECTITDNNITVFVASSFARPIDYEKLQKKESEFSLKYDFLKYQLEITKEKIEILTVKSDIKNIEKKNFEYLGIFIAIITFLFASIPTFSSSKLTLQDSLLSIIALGAVLTIFILLLKVFQNTSKKATNTWLGISLGVSTALFILLRLGIF